MMAPLPWDLPWLRQFPGRETSQAGLRTHVCTQARVPELAPSHPCSAPGPWHSLPAVGAAPPGLNARFLGVSASAEPSSPSLCQHSGEGCSGGKRVGVPVVMGPCVCAPVPPVTPRASGDADEVLDGIPQCGAGAVTQPGLSSAPLSPPLSLCHCGCATTAEPWLRFAGP